ncbi:hypothetical protein CFC21_102068 [Triticum aestivum]|uniref:Uncharacterized protein n=2 Tax=Triticum aestivum TaxID=4565 RepID=A0A3B6SGW9_WHEAT|nr:hypothetical protein CFC21_102068 [Triticum aestivum]
MEPVIRGRPTYLEAHYPLVQDHNALVCLVNITPAMPVFLPWLKRVFHQRLGIAAVRFAGSSVATAFVVFQRETDQMRALRASPVDVGPHRVDIRPHHARSNSFSFAYRHIVCLSLEKMPLELWSRCGVAASVSGFADLINVEHACLHGRDFAGIFVLAKVEALQHIPHHISFHKINGTGPAYADVYINEIWDVARSLGNPAAPPRSGHHQFDGRGHSPPRSPPARGRTSRTSSLGLPTAAERALRAYKRPHLASFDDFMAMLKLSAKPKFKVPVVTGMLDASDFDADSENDGHLKRLLVAAPVARPHAVTYFDPDHAKFFFKLELSLGRVFHGAISVGPSSRLDDGYFPVFDLSMGKQSRQRCTSLLFKFWPKSLSDDPFAPETMCSRTLPLLPSVDCRFAPKANVPLSLFNYMGPSLSLATAPASDSYAASTAFLQLQCQIWLTSPPTCTMPATAGPSSHASPACEAKTDLLTGTPLVHASFYSLPAAIAPYACGCLVAPTSSQCKASPVLLPLFPTSSAAATMDVVNSAANPVILDSSASVDTPAEMVAGDPAASKDEEMRVAVVTQSELALKQAPPRRSARLMNLLDGPRVRWVERAAKRKESLSASTASGSSSAHSSGPSSAPRKRAKKIKDVSSLIELPLKRTPKTIWRNKLKALSYCCDLIASDILLKPEDRSAASTSHTASVP